MDLLVFASNPSAALLDILNGTSFSTKLKEQLVAKVHPSSEGTIVRANYSEFYTNGFNGDDQDPLPISDPDPSRPEWRAEASGEADILYSESSSLDGLGGDDVLFGGVGQNTLLGGNGNDIIWGRGGDDTLKGGSGDDIIRGGADDDTLSGGGGDDLLDGGDINLTAADDGTDKADYSGAANGIFIELGGGTQEDVENGIIHVTDDGNGGADTLHSIEKIIGTNKGDTAKIVGAVGSLPEIDLGANLEDTLDRVDLSGISQGIKIDMGATGPKFGSGLTLKVKGAEVVIGTSGDDSINGGDADDQVSGGGGADKIIGGAGNDILFGEDGNDFIKGDDDGDDLLLGGSGADYIIAGNGDDIVDGGPGNDYIEINGTDGATIVFAEGSGHDVLGSMFTKREGTPFAGENYIPHKWYDVETHGDVLVRFEGLNTSDVELVWNFEDRFLNGVNQDAGGTRWGEAALRIISTGDTLYLGTLTYDYYYTDYFDEDPGKPDFGIILLDDYAFQYPFEWGPLGSYIGLAGQVDFNWMQFGEGSPTSLDKIFSLRTIAAQELLPEYSSALKDYSDTAGTQGDDDMEGSDGSDVLLSGDGRDRLYSGDGDDFVFASGGDDEIEAGSGLGDDYYDGGVGIDVIRFPSTSLGIVVNLAAGTADGVEIGHDILVGIENVFGGAGNDVLIGNGADNELSGEGGSDNIDGAAGNDTLNGGAGDDVLDGGVGDDNLAGGDGNDNITGGDGADSVDGSSGNDILSGGAGDDVLDGGNGDDNLAGGDGNDRIYGGLGADTIDGGDGTDTVEYRYSAVGVAVSLMGNTATGGDAEGDTLAGIENLAGSYFDDLLTGDGAINRLTGGVGDDTLDGGAGNDVLVGGEGADALIGGAGTQDAAGYQEAALGVVVNLALGGTGGEAEGDTYSGVEYVYGTEFDDVVTGDSAINRLTGGAGDDTLDGAAGNDILVGGDGADTLIGGAGTQDAASYQDAPGFQDEDSALLGVIVDLALGGTGGEALGDTYSGIEYVYGSAFNDRITGDGAINRLTGGGGDDTLDGAGGNDVLVGGVGADTLIGGAGTQDAASYQDAIIGVIADLALGGTGGEAAGDTYSGIEYVYGSAYADEITGDAAVNRLTGGAGNDTLNGAAGNDYLLGNAGDDTLVGGLGADVFVFEAGLGNDTISDFWTGVGTTDRVWFTALGFDDFTDVQANALDGAAGVVVTLAGEGSLTFTGITLAQLNADDFIFS